MVFWALPSFVEKLTSLFQLVPAAQIPKSGVMHEPALGVRMDRLLDI